MNTFAKCTIHAILGVIIMLFMSCVNPQKVQEYTTDTVVYYDRHGYSEESLSITAKFDGTMLILETSYSTEVFYKDFIRDGSTFYVNREGNVQCIVTFAGNQVKIREIPIAGASRMAVYERVKHT
jgi:hypothetical protein